MAMKRRFIAPLREQVDRAGFAHPLYAHYTAFMAWMQDADWPCMQALNEAMPLADREFALQDQALLADQLHYETRIAQRGKIATRPQNWHDLFNAMVWCRWPMLKQALNARQLAHIAEMGPSERNRAQYALTQFDEAGVIVRIKNPELMQHWNTHDWSALFHDHAGAWKRGDIGIVAVIGHALLEHGLLPAQYLVGKALVIEGDADSETCVSEVSSAIRAGQALLDPLELRPLPLAGVPGWFAGQDADFYREAPCFQPMRAGRAYPPVIQVGL